MERISSIVSTPENKKERQIKIEFILRGYVQESKQFESISIDTTKQIDLRNRKGVLSMTRDTPNSATSSFFYL